MCARLGARYITGLQQQTDFPVLSATAVAQWVADGSPGTTDTQETFAKLSFRGHTVIGIEEFTRLTLLTSTPAVQDAVRNDLTQVIARAIDLAALTGSAAPSPIGILGTPGLPILNSGTNGGAITWPAVLALIEEAQIGNAPETALGWASTPRVRAQAMGTLKFPGVSGSMAIMDEPNTLAGYPFAATNALPLSTKGTGTGLSTLIYGSWDEVIIAMFGEGVEVLASPYGTTQFASGNVQVRVLATCDVQLKHVASFAALTDVAAP